MHNHHVFTLGELEPFNKIINMHMHPDLCSPFVLRIKEGALGDDHLGIADIVAQQVGTGECVAGVGEERDFDVVDNLFAALLHIAQLFLRQPDKVLFELGAFFDDDIATRWRGVLSMKSSEDDVVFDLDLLLVLEGDQLVRSLLAFEVLEPIHHSSNIRLDAFVTHNRARAHPLEVALRAPIREPADMIHMPMAERTKLGSECRSRGHAHIKADIHLRDINTGRFAGDRVALNTQGVEKEEAERAVAWWWFGDHGALNSVDSVLSLKIVVDAPPMRRRWSLGVGILGGRFNKDSV